jgi:hypothetical protein
MASTEGTQGKYRTIQEFCEANCLHERRIRWYAEELNRLWIRDAHDPKSLREFLDVEWKNGNIDIKGTCGWIVGLLKLGATLRAPVIAPEGTAFLLESKERTALLRELQKAYLDMVIASLRFSAHNVDGRVARSFNQRSVWHMQVLSTKVKLLWALLGYSTEGCNLGYYLRDEHLLEAKLLPLLRANVKARKMCTIPKRLIELEDSAIELFAGAAGGQEGVENLA